MAIPIELQDVNRVLSQLVMPSPRRPGCPSSVLRHLAPIEMAAQSIHLHQPYHPLVASMGLPVPGPPSKGHSGGVSIPVAPDPFPPPSHTKCIGGSLLGVQGWGIPLGYACCGLCMGLCNLIIPAHITQCAHLLCPIWTLTLGMHAAMETDPLWVWTGLMCLLLLPFVILVKDLLFVGFYLLVFTFFTSGRFWLNFQGPCFILICICWTGLVVCCILSIGSDHPRSQISVAGFFALSASIIASSRLGRLCLRVG
jgi:hypothetical protein